MGIVHDGALQSRTGVATLVHRNGLKHIGRGDHYEFNGCNPLAHVLAPMPMRGKTAQDRSYPYVPSRTFDGQAAAWTRRRGPCRARGVLAGLPRVRCGANVGGGARCGTRRCLLTRGACRASTRPGRWDACVDVLAELVRESTEEVAVAPPLRAHTL